MAMAYHWFWWWHLVHLLLRLRPGSLQPPHGWPSFMNTSVDIEKSFSLSDIYYHSTIMSTLKHNTWVQTYSLLWKCLFDLRLHLREIAFVHWQYVSYVGLIFRVTTVYYHRRLQWSLKCDSCVLLFPIVRSMHSTVTSKHFYPCYCLRVLGYQRCSCQWVVQHLQVFLVTSLYVNICQVVNHLHPLRSLKLYWVFGLVWFGNRPMGAQMAIHHFSTNEKRAYKI